MKEMTLNNSTAVERKAAVIMPQVKTPAKIAKAERKIIPVFFASDDNYAPFLDVAMRSLKENASKNYVYKIYVLHSGMKRGNADKIMILDDENFSVSFVDVSEKLAEVQEFMQLRDYYTSAIYYRLFIVGMFPQYDKAVYLDSDTVTLGDVGELYSYELGNNLIGAVADGAVASVPAFREYTKKALGVDGGKYFNSGVIVMNLKKFRAEKFYQKFYDLLKSYQFTVAPDQDCLNILCKGRVRYFAEAWNRMPQGVNRGGAPKLIHYNLAQKPWHYDDILYQEYFWEYAKKSPFYEDIKANRAAFTPEMAARDELGGKNLVKLALKEAESEKNYYRLYGEKAKAGAKNGRN